MPKYWIWLSSCPNINNRAKYVLLQHFGTPEAVFRASDAERAGAAELSRAQCTALREYPLSEGERLLEKCQLGGIKLLTFQDPGYPNRLKNIYDPPILLYYKGNLPDFDRLPAVAVVGTRKASPYGFMAARRLGFEIASCGGLVVSGLADGIDGSAMSGALTAGKPVVGVLGCGADIVYPRSNRDLFEDVRRYGCILTEFAPGTPPVRWNFPMRNRIISGLCCGVLVVEAPERSGSLITASCAAEQGRDVFVVPGNVDLPGFVGSNRLLKDGAGAVSCGWDVMSEYEAAYPDIVSRSDAVLPELTKQQKPAAVELKVAQKPVIPEKKQPEKAAAGEKSIDNGASAPYIDLSTRYPNLSEKEKKILSALGPGDRLVDDIIAETGLASGIVLGLLTMLELKGIVARLPGRRIGWKAKP